MNDKTENKTALHLACYEGHTEIVECLLQHKADANIVDDEGDTALHYAAFGWVAFNGCIFIFSIIS